MIGVDRYEVLLDGHGKPKYDLGNIQPARAGRSITLP